MSSSPLVFLFDVNETLSDLAPMADYFADVGAPPLLSELWFSAVLRDGFALAAASSRGEFSPIAREHLHHSLSGLNLNRSQDAAVDHIMRGFSTLSVHADVAPGVRALAAAPVRLVTLSNGSSDIANKLLTTAGIRENFTMLLSADDAPGWKPISAAYEYAAHTCGVDLSQMLMIAVHPWDIHGAALAGMRTAWINRTATGYPSYFEAPDFSFTTIGDLGQVLSAGSDAAVVADG